MTTYSWAGQGLRAPNQSNLTLMFNTSRSQSPLTGAIQTAIRAGTHWVYDLIWSNLKSNERRDLLGFFSRLNGGEHRVALPLFGEVNDGVWSGTPKINGGSQGGVTLNIDGAPNSVSKYARRGDLFLVGNAFRRVTADADSNASGQVAVSFIPPIRTSPADNTLITANPKTSYATYILTTPIDHGNTPFVDGPMSHLTLSFIDDLRA